MHLRAQLSAPQKNNEFCFAPDSAARKKVEVVEAREPLLLRDCESRQTNFHLATQPDKTPINNQSDRSSGCSIKSAVVHDFAAQLVTG